MVGQKIAQYQFLEKLGAGGMGEIYKAQDTKLNRFVAIKVLTTSGSGDPERRRRFIQEAQAASALNHPNIITIHDILSEDGSEYMVMEYVSGKTLVDLIPKGGLRLPQALKLAVQMTDALTAAHSVGIVHRDLKPANVMVTESGLVKILDFGLAKLTDRGPVTTTGDNTQTIADAPLTVEGSIIGTVSYMSPEQAQGKKVDTRSDIFSFGVVLYEMVTGVRAFGGDNALSTLSAILRDEARPLAEVAPDVPQQIEQVIKRCLRKNPDDRWQTMQDVKAALAALKHESDSGQLYKPRIPDTPKQEKAASSKAPLIAVGAIVIVGGIGGGLFWAKRHKQPPPVVETAAVAAPQPVQPAPPPTQSPGQQPSVPAEPAEAVLTNDNIIELVTNKVPTAVIVGQIRAAAKTNFSFTSAELIRLTKANVPAFVIEVMRNPKAPLPEKTAVAKNNVPAPAKSAPQETPAPVSAPPPAPVPVPVAAAPATAPPPVTRTLENITVVTIPDGAPLQIILSADVPADAAEGQPLRFTTAQDFRAGDTVVIAKGALVTGAIAEVGGKKKFLGIGGSKATFRLMQVDGVDGHKLNIRALPSKQAGGASQRPLEPAGKKPPKELIAAAGTEYIGYIDGEQTVSVKK